MAGERLAVAVAGVRERTAPELAVSCGRVAAAVYGVARHSHALVGVRVAELVGAALGIGGAACKALAR